MRELVFREFISGRLHYWGFFEGNGFKGPAIPSIIKGKHDQFTGIFDINGIRIFENDIIEIANIKTLKGDTGIVKFMHGSWKAQFSHHNFLVSTNQRKSYHFKVIGNTHCL